MIVNTAEEIELLNEAIIEHTINGDLELLQTLLKQKGANIAVEHAKIIKHGLKEKFSLLHLAAQYGHVKIIELLLSKGIKVDILTNFHKTPLMLATKYGQKNAVLCLLAHKAHINMQDDRGYTALFYAAIYEYPDIIKILLTRGANKNLQDKARQTALVRSIKHMDIPEMIKLLLQGGAADKEIQQAIGQAIIYIRPNILRLLAKRYPENLRAYLRHFSEEMIAYIKELENIAPIIEPYLNLKTN